MKERNLNCRGEKRQQQHCKNYNARGESESFVKLFILNNELPSKHYGICYEFVCFELSTWIFDVSWQFWFVFFVRDVTFATSSSSKCFTTTHSELSIEAGNFTPICTLFSHKLVIEKLQILPAFIQLRSVCTFLDFEEIPLVKQSFQHVWLVLHEDMFVQWTLRRVSMI